VAANPNGIDPPTLPILSTPTASTMNGGIGGSGMQSMHNGSETDGSTARKRRRDGAVGVVEN